MTPTEEKCTEYFSEILHVLKSTNQYEKVLHLIVDRITRMYACQTCAVVLINPKTEYLNIENSIGLSYTFCKEFRKKLAVGAMGEVLWTGKPVVIPDQHNEPIHATELQLEKPFGSCICVQVGVDNRTVGYLHVDSAQPNMFSRDDLKVIQALADLAAIAVNKSRLHDENLRLDTIDHDTELEKYSAFSEKLKAGVERAQQFNEHVAVLLLDVDNYKTILGTYGYESSIKFLRELGGLFRSQLRSIDASGRYGFDEFIAMLSKTDLEEAVEFAHKLCRQVETTAFVTNTIQTTISIGVSAYPHNGNTVDELIQSAKHALFEAQRAGRNSVFFYPAEWFATESAAH